jgi:hypothetical protein
MFYVHTDPKGVFVNKNISRMSHYSPPSIHYNRTFGFHFPHGVLRVSRFDSTRALVDSERHVLVLSETPRSMGG